MANHTALRWGLSIGVGLNQWIGNCPAGGTRRVCRLLGGIGLDMVGD